MKTTFLVNFNQDLERAIRPTHHSTSKYTTNSWFLNIDLVLSNGILFLDLKKAFDIVNHNILIKRLFLYGIKGVALSWFTSYLNNQTQTCKMKQSTSSPITIQWSSSGVERRITSFRNLHLGVVIDENLSCNISKKISKAIGIIRNVKPLLSVDKNGLTF